MVRLPKGLGIHRVGHGGKHLVRIYLDHGFVGLILLQGFVIFEEFEKDII